MSTTPSEMLYPQFLLFGDSITQYSAAQDHGFALVSALQNAYIRRLDVINRGFSGYNTAHALHVLPLFMPTLSQATVRIVSICFGANDAVLPGALQHVALDQYSRNLRALVRHPALTIHSPRVLLITPPPVDEYQLEPLDVARCVGGVRRTAANTKRYADSCREVGKSLGLPVVDIWSAFMRAAGWEEGQPLVGSKEAEPSSVLNDLLSDGEIPTQAVWLANSALISGVLGLHFNPSAYKLMYDEVLQVVHRDLPDVTPERLPFLFPLWELAPRLLE